VFFAEGREEEEVIEEEEEEEKCETDWTANAVGKERKKVSTPPPPPPSRVQETKIGRGEK
jgi:hypothetical protein